jgi:decaprenylphospho-beta-D-ribofuranose 2-oxidase
MSRWAERELSGWGRVHKARCLAARPERQAELAATLASEGTLLAFGAGRSYGDVALNSGGRAVITSRLDRLLSFDPDSGLLVAEPGVTLGTLFDTFLPLGFAPPVAPGTGFATLGGAVANDVHGKNHHLQGSFGHHLEWLDLRLPNGESRRITAAEQSSLWRATLGGLGLTGLIERVALRLKRVPSNALVVRKRRIPDLDAFLAAFDAHSRSDYAVGWIDALARGPDLGRGILETAAPAERSLGSAATGGVRVPFDFPSFALGRTSVRAFNALYRRHVPAGGVESTMPYAKFLFPLDALHDWNRIYGRRGFHQFQCLVPFEGGAVTLRRMLEGIAQSGLGSFLAVLKAMGERGSGYLSFPAPGYTLALDFPNAPGVKELLARLERLAADAGGRVYLAKDATLSADLLPAMYPELDRFRAVLDEIDPQGRMTSDMARRLAIRKLPA